MNVTRQTSDDFVIPSIHTLKDALVAITNNRKGSLIVVDDAGRYVGVVSDGDIRRAMVKGATEFTPIEKFVNTNGLFLNVDVADEILVDTFEKRPEVLLIPLLDAERQVVSVALKG